MMDPLLTYQMQIRGQRASGYPNANYMQPHPYEMSLGGTFRQYPFRYDVGQRHRMQIKSGPNIPYQNLPRDVGFSSKMQWMKRRGY